MADPGRLTALADRALLPLGLLFAACGFVLAPEPVWAAGFYLFGVPLTLWIVLPATWRACAEPLLLAPVLLILWLALALLWSVPPQGEPSRWLWLWNCFCTLGWFLGCVKFAAPARASRQLVTTLIVFATLNALWSIGRFWAAGGVAERMDGWAETRHPILGALIIGLCLILALGRAAEARGWARAALLAAVAVMAAFIWLTGSRGPLAATVAGAAVLLCGFAWRRLALMALALVIAAGLAALADPALIRDLIAHMAERGWSLRLGIWRQSLGLIAERPLFGYGLTALLPRPENRFPHSLFLSTWYYGGLVGLGLLLASFWLAARGLWRARPSWERLTLAGLGVCVCVGGLTDLAQVVKGPGPMWYIVWLPLALCITFIRREDRR